MEIIIDKNKTISAIQKEFQKRFPFLKIEFYQSAHAKGEGSHRESTLNTNLTIEEAQQKEASGNINIAGLMSVAELESAFMDVFGLSTQVFRKSGNIWLQTSATDHWTLAEQNHKAKESNEPMADDIIDAKDRMELE
jgi:uncharacterized pyridoxal phosphate-containing UPF0001 family protein